MVATRRQRARSSSESAAADASAPGPPAMSRSTSMESLSNSLRRTKHRVEATVKRKKTQVKKEIKKQKAKIDQIFDRDAWWTSLGYDPAVKARSVRWVERGVTCVVLALVGASQLVEAPHIPTPFSMYRFATASVLLWCGGMSLFTDTWRNPPPERGSDSHCCSSTLGPYAFFTKQALTIQTSHLIVSWVAEAFSAPHLLAVSHCFAPFAAVVAVALTLLYLKLNWFEPTWRKEVLDATNARGVDFTQITLVAHLPPLPVAVLDCLVAKRPGVFPLELRNVLGVGLLISCYCAFYTLLTLVNHRLVGRYPYPFMRALTRAWHWLAFVVALLVLADGLILPATFALLAANPT
jgi:hypothetical protein